MLTSPLAPPALRDHEERVLVQPWNLNHDEFVAHAFDQLRQTCMDQPDVAATILRVLRMLIAHLEAEGYPQRTAALHRQTRMLLDTLAEQPGLHPEDLRRLQSLSSNETDPADHSR